MTKDQLFCLEFLSTFCFIQDLTNSSIIGVGKMFDGLYLLQDSSLSLAFVMLDDFLAKHRLGCFTVFSFVFSHNHLYSLWLSRLGQPSDPKLQSLSSDVPFL